MAKISKKAFKRSEAYIRNLEEALVDAVLPPTTIVAGGVAAERLYADTGLPFDRCREIVGFALAAWSYLNDEQRHARLYAGLRCKKKRRKK